MAREDERFDEVEIRVIRPRYFNKAGRFELGGNFGAVMNETFILTLLASGIISFHFSESFALEASGSYGFNIDKDDKRILFDKFDIRTQIFRTLFNADAVLQWTPMYGKWQLSGGRLIYFDTYFGFGGGLTGIDWKYSDFCVDPSAENEDANPVPADSSKSYPTLIFSGGQRYFVSKTTAFKFDIKYRFFNYNTLDAECDPISVEQSGNFGEQPRENVTIHLGASKFF